MPTRPALAPTPFHLLAKPTGAICNLDCKYCFFLSKEMLYPGSRFRMADELLETYIRQLLESQPGPEVIVGWQGGEPTLMGLEFFERSVEYVRSATSARADGRLHHPDQRHAARRRLVRVPQEAQVLVGLSVDGPREMHDAYRVDKGGKGTFDDVMRGWQCLNRHGVDVNILCTVHAGERRSSGRGLSLLPRRAQDRFHPVHPDRRARDARDAAGGQRGWGERGSDPRPLYCSKATR